MFAIATCSNSSLSTYSECLKPVTVPEVQRINAQILVKTSPIDGVHTTHVKSCSDILLCFVSKHCKSVVY